ncbi:MAG: tRNA 2-thiouridine(34) synthase MnmA [Candidatus Gracilibacteria bacterium]|nr:tRNA 2-thiouridine(34) synthase MnmA [Candidatus Gracilibacteria bacterium]
MRILVGLSGGVDSAVAAYLLKKEGHDVTAGFMINYMAPEGEYCPTKEDIEVAREVAAYLEIPFFTFDYVEEYSKKVLDYMYAGYQKGITPNPDIMCNSEIKFKAFLEEAMSLGFDAVATGHYARIEKKEGFYHLLKGIDSNKDQSYFLAGLNQFQLSASLFPIGHLEKPRVREIALEAGLPNANRKDSQGICFVGKVDMHKFLEKKIEKKTGNIVDTSGKILGQHDGVFFYTIGQRKGIQIGGGPALYVVKKDLEKNELIVGTEEDMDLFNKELTASNFNFLADTLEFPFQAQAKIRYRQEDQEVKLEDLGNNRIIAKFEKAQRGIASGQIIAIYIGDELIGSGVID